MVLSLEVWARYVTRPPCTIRSPARDHKAPAGAAASVWQRRPVSTRTGSAAPAALNEPPAPGNPRHETTGALTRPPAPPRLDGPRARRRPAGRRAGGRRDGRARRPGVHPPRG